MKCKTHHSSSVVFYNNTSDQQRHFFFSLFCFHVKVFNIQLLKLIIIHLSVISFPFPTCFPFLLPLFSGFFFTVSSNFSPFLFTYFLLPTLFLPFSLPSSSSSFYLCHITVMTSSILRPLHISLLCVLPPLFLHCFYCFLPPPCLCVYV